MARRILHDEYFLRAKREGYLARSAYKLKELHDKRRLFRKGDAVLDLGCAPGAWIQVALEHVGPNGVVVGVDLKPVEHPFPAHVHTLVADAFTLDPATLTGASGRPFDVLLSDMAPNTSGSGDDLLSARLCRRVLALIPDLLRPGGHLAMKVLEGSDYPDLLREARALFDDVKGFKPAASRSVSREIYIAASGRR